MTEDLDKYADWMWIDEYTMNKRYQKLKELTS